MPSGKGQPSPAPSKRLNVSRTVEAAMPSRRAISRVEIPAENFKRMTSRTWRIATLSAGIIAPLDCQRRDPKQASGGARRHSRPRAVRYGGRHHLVFMGGLGRNQQGRRDVLAPEEVCGQSPTTLWPSLPSVGFLSASDRLGRRFVAITRTPSIDQFVIVAEDAKTPRSFSTINDGKQMLAY